MYKVSILGDVNSIYGFATIGIETFFVYDHDDALKKLKQLVASESYAVIFITEKIYSMIEQDIKSYDNAMLPALIPIPGVVGNTSVGINNLRKSVEQAVGSDIIFGRG